MKAWSKIFKLKEFIATKMKDITTLIDNNVKYAVYIRGNIHGLYRYLEMIGATMELTNTG